MRKGQRTDLRPPQVSFLGAWEKLRPVGRSLEFDLAELAIAAAKALYLRQFNMLVYCLSTVWLKVHQEPMLIAAMPIDHTLRTDVVRTHHGLNNMCMRASKGIDPHDYLFDRSHEE